MIKNTKLFYGILNFKFNTKLPVKVHGVFRLAFHLRRICNGEFKFTELMLENSEEIVMRSCSLELTRQGIYATLEPSRVTAARLLEFSIHIYFHFN